MRLVLVLPAALAFSCASVAFQAGEPIIAPEGEAIGAMSIDTELYAKAVVFRSNSLKEIVLPHSLIGTTTHLFHAPPGEYCLAVVRFASLQYNFRERRSPSCFTLRAGRNRYLGRFLISRDHRFRRGQTYASDLLELRERYGRFELER